MSFKKKLVRGLAAAATIGAMSAGALLVAAPAQAAGGTVGPGDVVTVAPVTPSAMPEWTTIPATLTWKFRVTGGATFDPTQSSVARESRAISAAEWAASTGPSPSNCTLSEGDTLMTCTAAKSQSTMTEAFVRYPNVRVIVPADARNGDTYGVSVEWVGRTPNATASVTVDAVPVADLVVTSPADGAVVDSVNVAMTGTGEPGETVTITDSTGAVLGTTTVGANGNWSVTIPELPEGPATLTATSGDQSVSRDVVVVLDKEDTPIMALAGVGALGLFAAGGAGFAIRRRRNAA